MVADSDGSREGVNRIAGFAVQFGFTGAGKFTGAFGPDDPALSGGREIDHVFYLRC
jgi:hypothetical protein